MILFAKLLLEIRHVRLAPSHSSAGAEGVHGKLFMPESFFNECAIVRTVFNAPDYPTACRPLLNRSHESLAWETDAISYSWQSNRNAWSPIGALT